MEPFDWGRSYRLGADVTLRPEPFGALAYSFSNRRLTYLASGPVLAVLDRMSGQCSAAEAMAAAGVPDAQHASVARALASLVERGVLDAA